MLFWSKRRSAPNEESRRAACALSRRSVRSLAKSIRCSQSTAIVAPREAMFIVPVLPLQSVDGQRDSSAIAAASHPPRTLSASRPPPRLFVCAKQFGSALQNSPRVETSDEKCRSYKARKSFPSPGARQARLTENLPDQYL